VATKEEMHRRRKQLCSLMYRGVGIVEAGQKLAENYNVTAKTIQNDWYNREDWLPALFDLDDPDKMLLDLLSEQKEFKNDLWRLKNKTNNDNVKLGALKQLQTANKNFLEMLQETGLLDRKAMQLEIMGKDGGAIEIEGQTPTEKLLDEINGIAEKSSDND